MQAPISSTCIWPGLPRLWLAGQWRGLLTAVAFAGLLNVALASTFLWHGWLSPTARQLCWLTLGCFWLISAYRSLHWLRQRRDCRADETAGANEEEDGAPSATDQLFLAAQTEYLQGHWFEAESLLKELLGKRPHDEEAHMYLATLYRRRRRVDEAKKQLDALSNLEGGGKWAWEVYHEQQQLDRLSQELAKTTSNRSSPEPSQKDPPNTGPPNTGPPNTGPPNTGPPNTSTEEETTSTDSVSTQNSASTHDSTTTQHKPTNEDKSLQEASDSPSA